jgi:DNA-directed RNA polymerase subunit M/transcription elongation factor TFIIS
MDRTATVGLFDLRAFKERKKHMGLKTLPSEAAPICARCRVEMVEVFVRTIQFGDGHEDITYRCEECGAQQIRSIKPAWSV